MSCLRPQTPNSEPRTPNLQASTGGVIGGESLTAEAADSASGRGQSCAETEHGSSTRRFEYYEVMLDKDGKPIELVWGAMGVTYKALDVDLGCPRTLV
jgi:hypothetical protein